MRISMASAMTLAAATIVTSPSVHAMPLGRLLSPGQDVYVELERSDARFRSSLYLYDAQDLSKPITDSLLSTDARKRRGGAQGGSIGTEREVVFGIQVDENLDNQADRVYFTGTASQNADQSVHAVIDSLSPTSLRVSFEDMWGGGDRDFNDLVFQVTTVTTVTPAQIWSPATVVLVGSGLLLAGLGLGWTANRLRASRRSGTSARSASPV